MERLTRANLLNSLSGFKSVSLIGTKDLAGRPNLGVFSSVTHLGSDPAMIGYINRPREAAPHTLSNIESTGWFTINHIHPGILHQAHACSAKWPAEINEFSATGLTEEYIPEIPAPFVAESRVKYALKLVEVVPIMWNRTFLVIGSVQGIWLNGENIMKQDGFLDLEYAETLSSVGLDGYTRPGSITRLPYAKPVIATNDALQGKS